MYNPTIWKDEVVEHPYRYTEQSNSDGTVTHTPAPGTVLQSGTPQSATNFNKMENGVHDSHIAESIYLQYWIQKNKQIDQHFDLVDSECLAETGTITLNNTNAVNFMFNNSGTTVAMKQARRTMNYDLDIDIVTVTGGRLGEVIVYDKQLNGFKMKFTGSAKSVTVKYKIRGGMYA